MQNRPSGMNINLNYNRVPILTDGACFLTEGISLSC